ncbi:hypothetical protein GCM10009550_71510 [Actinocorallia libanotica]|uniref:Uncharacterized protein n=1 Tax=Actinocorallia libanotica TaxID=46162 RepID=A0ABP4CH94_9ACTN
MEPKRPKIPEISMLRGQQPLPFPQADHLCEYGAPVIPPRPMARRSKTLREIDAWSVFEKCTGRKARDRFEERYNIRGFGECFTQ